MIIPELKSIISPDLEYGQSPDDIENCSIFVELTIGPKGNECEEIFSFTVVTTKYLTINSQNRWGRGLLILEEFSWNEMETFISKLLNHCMANNWNEVANKLNNVIDWEFDNYIKYNHSSL